MNMQMSTTLIFADIGAAWFFAKLCRFFMLTRFLQMMSLAFTDVEAGLFSYFYRAGFADFFL